MAVEGASIVADEVALDGEVVDAEASTEDMTKDHQKA